MKVILIVAIFFFVVPIHGFAQDSSDLADAAFDLKRAHVLRLFKKCISQNQTDIQCRAELVALHPREIAALRKIWKNARLYNEYEVSKASAACYDPSHDYKDLIECWEQLAIKMALNEIILIESKTKLSFEEQIEKDFTKLDPLAKRSVFLCIKGEISLNFKNTVLYNLRKGGANGTWALKVNVFENTLLEKIAKAAQWSEMEQYYEAEAMNTAKLIRGKIDVTNYKAISKQNENFLGAALAKEKSRKSLHNKNFKKFYSICDKLSKSVIGQAKVLASQ